MSFSGFIFFIVFLGLYFFYCLSRSLFFFTVFLGLYFFYCFSRSLFFLLFFSALCREAMDPRDKPEGDKEVKKTKPEGDRVAEKQNPRVTKR